jgi:hypothetical protein
MQATLLSLVLPFLSIVVFFIGLALLVEGLIPIAFPVCLVGYSISGFPVVGRCVSAFNVSLFAAGSIIVAASAVWMRHVYLRRGFAKSRTPN